MTEKRIADDEVARIGIVSALAMKYQVPAAEIEQLYAEAHANAPEAEQERTVSLDEPLSVVCFCGLRFYDIEPLQSHPCAALAQRDREPPDEHDPSLIVRVRS